MNNAKKQIGNSLFILSSSFEKIVEKARGLNRLAALAYDHRNYKLLAQLADELKELSPLSESCGLYWQGMSLGQQGKGDKETTVKIFEDGAINSSIKLRGAHLISLSNGSILKGDLKGAEQLVKEALSISSDVVDWIRGLSTLSLLCSLEDDHNKSLIILRAIYPFVCTVGRERPTLLLDLLNSAAYEHYSLGNVALAANLIKPVLASSIIKYYPEWEATRDEISSALLQKPSRSFVSVKEYEKVINEPIPVENKPKLTLVKNNVNVLPFQKPDTIEIRFCYEGGSDPIVQIKLKSNNGIILGLFKGLESIFTRQLPESKFRLQLILHIGNNELEYHDIGIHPDDIERLDETKHFAQASHFTVIEDEVIDDELIVKRVTKQIISIIHEDEAKMNS